MTSIQWTIYKGAQGIHEERKNLCNILLAVDWVVSCTRAFIYMSGYMSGDWQTLDTHWAVQTRRQT